MVKPGTEVFDHMMVSHSPTIARRMGTKSGRSRTGPETTIGVTRRMGQIWKMFHDCKDVSAAEPLRTSPHIASELRRRRAEGSQSAGIRNLAPNRASVDDGRWR